MLSTGNPAFVVNRAVRNDLEVLALANGSGLGIIEGTGDRHAVHRLLFDTIDRGGYRQLGDIKDRGNDVDEVAELIADTADILDPSWPGHDHRVSRAAQMRRHLLDPRERRIPRPRPFERIVRFCVRIAD